MNLNIKLQFQKRVQLTIRFMTEALKQINSQTVKVVIK